MPADACVTPEVDCSTSVSNFYVTSRDRVLNKTTQYLLCAFFDIPHGNVADLYRAVLTNLSLKDTPENFRAFSKAFHQIISAKTRTCTIDKGCPVTILNITQVCEELRKALDTCSDLTIVTDIFGRVLCLEGLLKIECASSCAAGLPTEYRRKIFGLAPAQRPYSLGFVVDDTGSMSSEIVRVQQIIRGYVDENVGAPTHYILATFNDPG